LVARFLLYFTNVDAAPLEAVFDNVDVPQHIDRNGLLCNNVFEFAPNVFAIYLTIDLSVDYTFDLDANLPWYIPVWRAILKGLAAISKWWQEDVPNWVKVTVGIILLIAAIVLAYFTGGASTALASSAEVISTLISQALTQLLIGIGMAIVSWAISGLITGDFSWQSLENAVADAVFFTGLFAFASASVNALKGASRCTRQPKQSVECETKCFFAGTLVICKDDNGNVLQKPIEEIKPGDLVWSFDEETGKNDWKPVVHLFRNQATEWTEVTVDGEKIVATPGHKFYLPKTKTWCPAYQLTVGTKLLLSNGQLGTVEKVKDIQFNEPQTTYNFEVSEFHTYYVGEGVLVHNEGPCGKISDTVPDNYQPTYKNGSYESNPKHGKAQHGKASPGIGNEAYAQYALDNAISVKGNINSLYAWNGENLIQFKGRNNVYHGYISDIRGVNNPSARNFLRHHFRIK